MNVLIIGAGAVGQVYGYHLQQGGARVSFYVREKYAAEARAGYTLYRLNQRREPLRFAGFGVVTRADEVAAQSWDQVWFCIPSTGLQGQWLDPMLEAIAGATIVNMMPGAQAAAGLAARWSGPVVQGLINMISYQAPLEGDGLPEPGVAYWFPPGPGSPFSGPGAADVVRALKAGGCGAQAVADVSGQVYFGSAAMMPAIAALEGAGWSFDAFKRGEWLSLAARGTAQAAAAVAAREGASPPFALRLLGPTALRAALWLGPKLIPIPLETYLAYHFTKVGQQTRDLLASWIQAAEQHALPADALQELQRAIGGEPSSA